MFELRLTDLYIYKENVEKLIEQIKKNSSPCDAVWFSTAYGYPSIDVHRQRAEKLKENANLFRENGITVSLQISNTLGHGEYMRERDCSGLIYEGSPAERIVGPDGKIAEYSFCFYGTHFREYIHETTKLYASILPYAVWIDDDLRVTNHAPVEIGCYCDNCIMRFNETYQSHFTREELVHEINYGDLNWRERYMAQMRHGMYEFTTFVANSILEESPDSIMALQYVRSENYLGSNYNYLFEALYDVSGKNVKSRPGGGFYCDKQPMDMLTKAMMINFSNSALPDYVLENYPEIECLPNVIFGKSYEGICKEAALYLAYGCNGLTFAALNNGQEIDEYDEKLLYWFSVYNPYWKELINRNAGTKCGGVGIYSSKNAYKKPLINGDEPFSWMKITGVWDTTFMKIGLPISNDQDAAKVLFLHSETVDYMTEEDIEELLHKPVITNAESVRKLIERGFGKHFGFKVKTLQGDDCLGREYFSEHKVNEGFVGDYCKESFFVSLKDPIITTLVNCDELSEILGTYVGTKTKGDSEVVSAIVKTYDKTGRALSRWAVFGYCFGIDILSSKKRNQIINAVDYICDSSLPAKLLSNEQIVVIPRVDIMCNTVSVSLQSCTIGTSGELRLRIRNPKKNEFKVMRANAKMQNLDFELCDYDYEMKLPPLGPWEMLTVFCS